MKSVFLLNVPQGTFLQKTVIKSGLSTSFEHLWTEFCAYRNAAGKQQWERCFYLIFTAIIKAIPTYQQLPDDTLVQQYKQSEDQQFLAILYQRYNGLIFGVCLKYLKDPDGAADASLDIYEELTQKVLKYEIENFKGWLHTLTRNHCLMKLRSGKNKHLVELPEHLMQMEETVHLNGVMEKELHLTQLESCIEKLNNEQKQVVQLFYLQEKCYNDITTETGLPWNVVRSHIQNGRRNLKICMDQYASQ